MMRCYVALIILACAIVCTPYATAAQSKEDKVKAVFLFKLFRYIDWPNHDAHHTICVYGTHSFGDALDYIIENKFQSADYRVRYVNAGGSLAACDMAFLSRLERGAMKRMLSVAEEAASVLMVSDAETFAELGGHVEFKETPGKITLLLNMSKIRHAKFKSSAKLMNIAEMIE